MLPIFCFTMSAHSVTILSFLFLGIFCQIQAKTQFKNPILKENNSPSVIKVAGLYYMFTDDQSDHNKIPIYVSSDLTTWTLKGHVLSEKNFPKFALSPNETALNPDIHFIGGNYIIYFNIKAESGLSVIAAATSDSPAGPYKSLQKPVFEDHELSAWGPNVAQNGGYSIFCRYFEMKSERHFVPDKNYTIRHIARESCTKNKSKMTDLYISYTL